MRTPQGYSLDAVVSHGGREVAVVIDGPSHFRGRTPTGGTVLKWRQLRAAGWALLPVPYWEWGALSGSKAAKREYFRTALDMAILAPRPSMPTAVSLAGPPPAAPVTLDAAAPLSPASVQYSNSGPGHTRSPSADSVSVQSHTSSASGHTRSASADWTKRMLHLLSDVE